jgi:aromatase
MRSVDRISIASDARTVFDLAARVEDWPAILPHYRWVKVYADEGRRRVVEMAAWRNRWPCRWLSVQTLDAVGMSIEYRHIGGITRGMWVEWLITPTKQGCEVTLVHKLTYPPPILGPLFARFIVGRMFVHHIAVRTLAGIKRAAETSC